MMNFVYGYFQCHAYQNQIFNWRIYQSLCGLGRSEVFTPQENDVAIHLRRGDFVTTSEIYKIFKAEHYLKGLSVLNEEREVGKVYVFSDDFSAIEEEIQILSQSYELCKVEGNSVVDDIVQMAQFRRFVLANSTFSWWAAFMAESQNSVRVVVPERPLEWHNSNDEYYPEHWVKI